MKLSASVTIVSFFLLGWIFQTSHGLRPEIQNVTKLLNDDVNRVLDRLRATLLATESSIVQFRRRRNFSALVFVAVISVGDILTQHSGNLLGVGSQNFSLGDLYTRIGCSLTFGTFAGDRVLHQYKRSEHPGCGLEDLDEVIRRFGDNIYSFEGNHFATVGRFLGQARRSVRCILEGDEKRQGLTKTLELAFLEVEEAMDRRTRAYRRLLLLEEGRTK